jgi:phenylalanyl-tRNA synthetase beta chain
MKISFNWLKEYISITDTPEQVSEVLTATGLEVEGLDRIEGIKGGLAGLVIGKVLTCEQHPNADKLKITTVDIGTETPAKIVCGAPNVDKGQTVIVATIGSTLYPTAGGEFKIKKSKIRGEVSEGMICAEDEIGLGTEHDGIMVLETNLATGTPAAEYFDFEDDYLIEIGLTPNRADATSHIGVARDLRAIYHEPVKWPSVENFKPDNNNLPIAVLVENTEACPRYSGVTISGITVAESPEWLKRKLQTIGLNPINNLVDITNFVLHETGQPLHAFDAREIKGNKIVVKTLAKNTSFTTLDEQVRKLGAEDLMICNEAEGMCIAGVLGGLHSGVTDDTTSIFLESAYFSPAYIRRSVQRHQIRTDASFRFERGTDPKLTVYALQRAALLIKEIAGGEISSSVVDIYPNAIHDFSVPIKKKNIDRLIGKQLPEDEIRQILADLDIRIENEDKDSFVAMVPPYRVDVQREADVIEEILRIHGFDNVELPDTVGASFLAEFPEIDANREQQKVSSYLTGNGYYEIMTNSLTKPEYANMASSLSSDENVVILNKLSEDLGVLRQNLVFSGLEIISYNTNRRQKDLKIFEFGKQYKLKNNKYVEEMHLGMWITGLAESENWANSKEPVKFHDLAGPVNRIFDKMNIHDFTISPATNPIFQFGLSIEKNNKVMCEYGKVNLSIAKKLGVKQEIFYADFNWDLFLSQTNDNIVVERASRFPEVRRDLSLVIDNNVQFIDILDLTRKTERKLIKKVDVFDMYEGDNLGKGKKAYSIKFILEDTRKTLTDKVIDKTMNRLIGAFESELGALIRQ